MRRDMCGRMCSQCWSHHRCRPSLPFSLHEFIFNFNFRIPKLVSCVQCEIRMDEWHARYCGFNAFIWSEVNNKYLVRRDPMRYELPLQSFQNENKWASLNCRISSRSGGYWRAPRASPAVLMPLHAIYLNPFEQFFIFCVRTTLPFTRSFVVEMNAFPLRFETVFVFVLVTPMASANTNQPCIRYGEHRQRNTFWWIPRI